MSRPTYTGDISLGVLPDWFIELDNSLELISLWYKENPTEKEDKLKEVFESVFVLAYQYEKDDDGEDVEVVDFCGFDTLKDLAEDLKKNWEKECSFIRHTKKGVWLQAELDVQIEVAPGQTQTVKDSKPESDSETEKGKDKSDTRRYPMPGLQTGLPAGPGETRPGEAGPRRVP